MLHIDLAGIGAGPANLSLAALAEPIGTLRCRFFERQEDMRWHPGLMLPGSLLQVSYLKDLVTLVDPTNRYTFLNFLAQTGRLHRFASIPRQDVSRREFESYYRWAARELGSVEPGCEVLEVTHRGSAFRVGTSRGTHTARHISVGVGPAPWVPESAAPHLGATVFHSSEFAGHLEGLAGQRVVVVGGGQSGAEVVAHLLDFGPERAVLSLVWVTRRPGFPPLDDTAFTNEWFQPDYVRYFHQLPEQRRRQLLLHQQLASDGISASLLERIYRRLYEADFVDGAPVSYALLPGRQLARLSPSADLGGGWRAELTHQDTGTQEAVRGDIVILATGYRFRIPGALLPIADRIDVSGGGEPVLAADYSARWDGPAGNKLFFLNAGRLSHGIADPNLSLASWRAAVVLNSLTGGAVHQAVHATSSVSTWGPRPLAATNNHAVPVTETERSRSMSLHQLIVPTNPTPNGDVHIGHIAGPFIGADALRRAALQRGESASVLLGTAWQNNHVVLAARRRGLPYLEVAASFSAQIEASFESVGIEHDVMLRQADIPVIRRETRLAYDRLRADGSVVLREARAQFCPGPACQDWRFQGFVAGRCPHCGSPDAAGIDCEGCGIYHDDSELLEPRCSVCGEDTVTRAVSRAFLELEPKRGWFEDYFSRVVMGSAVRRFAEDVLSRPLPSVAVTCPGTFGIAAAEPELPGQMIYPAFELAPRYSVMAQQYRAARAAGGAAWAAGAVPAGGAAKLAGSRMTMIFGFDNAFERVFLFPAVLNVLDTGCAPLPDIMQMSYFYLLDGRKFSTSRGHLIGVRDLVDEAGADAVRLYLSATRPETGTSDFRRADFLSSPEIATVRTLTRWAQSGSIAAGTDPLPEDGGRKELAEASWRLYEALLPDTLSCSRAAEALLRLTRLAGAAALSAPADALMNDILHAVVNGAGALIPHTAGRLREAFSVPEMPFDGAPSPEVRSRAGHGRS